MRRDEIYDHLAQVYLGKRSSGAEERKRNSNFWLMANVVITVLIFASAFYGLTAFWMHRKDQLQKNIIFSLNNSPIRLKYNLNAPYPQVKSLSIPIPDVDVAKYQNLRFSIRGMEEGYPGIIKIVLKNQRNETSFHFIKNVRLDWKDVVIPLEEFREITDWKNVTDLSFVLEAWNAEKSKGIVLIDDVCFSS